MNFPFNFKINDMPFGIRNAKLAELSELINTEITNNYIFVSPLGNDDNDGSFDKPVSSLHIARDLAQSGQTVYVLPGEWLFDNTVANGSPYNGVANELVNLWKNGVTYYFSPGAKVKMLNSRSQSQLILFKPSGDGYEECNVVGHLDFYGEQVAGGSGGNGTTFFFDAEEIDGATSSGYTFNAEVDKLISTMPPMNLIRNDKIEIPMYLNLKCKELATVYKDTSTTWLTGGALLMRGTSLMHYNIEIDYLHTNFHYAISFMNNYHLDSTYNIHINRLETYYEGYIWGPGFTVTPIGFSSQNSTSLRVRNQNIKVHINNCFYDHLLTRIDAWSYGGAVISGKFIQKTSSGFGSVLVRVTGSAHSGMNLKIIGDIYYKSATPPVISNNYTNVITMEGDIYYINSDDSYTGNLFDVQGGRIEFNGNISFTNTFSFDGVIGRVRNTTLRIYNSTIRTAGNNGRLLNNNTTTSGVFALDNSKVIINGDSLNLINGGRVGVSINNSVVYNTSSDTGSTVYDNTLTDNGTLYINNSSLISLFSGDTINSNSKVIASNSAIRVLESLPTLFEGDITINENLNSY